MTVHGHEMQLALRGQYGWLLCSCGGFHVCTTAAGLHRKSYLQAVIRDISYNLVKHIARLQFEGVSGTLFVHAANPMPLCVSCGRRLWSPQ